jgi:hypothetical protein
VASGTLPRTTGNTQQLVARAYRCGAGATWSVFLVKIAINTTYGGFNISRQAAEWLRNRGHPEAIKAIAQREEWAKTDDWFRQFYWIGPENRTDPLLIECIETLGEAAAGGNSAHIKIVEIPDDVEWELQDYDGTEWIAEKHRTWS